MPVAVDDARKVGVELEDLPLERRVQRPVGRRPSPVGGQARVSEEQEERVVTN